MAAKKHFTINSTRELRDFANYMERYRRTFEFNVRVFLMRVMTEIGIPCVDNRYGIGAGDSPTDHTTYFSIDHSGNKVVGTLYVEGEAVAFIEFGAGIKYNGAAGSSPHDLGAELGFTIGSYGHGLGRFDHWYYKDPTTGETIRSEGTEATMPLYLAKEAMIGWFATIAKEVFALV